MLLYGFERFRAERNFLQKIHAHTSLAIWMTTFNRSTLISHLSFTNHLCPILSCQSVLAILCPLSLSLLLSGLFVLAWESLRFVYASRSSLASKFIVALWAFCVYYYCGSRIHSVPFSFFSFVLFISSVLSLSLSRRVVLVSFIFGYCVCVCLQFPSYLIRIHLQNVCFVFSHVINFNLAKNRKQRSKWWCCHWCCCCNNHTFRAPSFAHIVIWS